MSEKAKLKVLIADDEPHIRLMLKTIMTSMNAQVAGEAQNGQEAIDLFKQEKPHITLLDINMPIKTGEVALAEIKSDTPDALVIMMTSVADVETIQKCIELGANSYILKDTPLQEIKKMIKEAWSEHVKNR
jgi:two-component system chemotaxis response regulator CheY